eukprot:scaffold438904_cov29-Prasinocladus_malaysianus.AAC.1
MRPAASGKAKHPGQIIHEELNACQSPTAGIFQHDVPTKQIISSQHQSTDREPWDKQSVDLA